jgi:SAM-dependent methyltransferase
MTGWEEYFVDDPARFVWQDDGIVLDRHVVSDGQDEELLLRDNVAAPFMQSRDEAVREATRHHARGPMLRRAEEMTRAAGEGAVILDIGCGFGWHWVELSLARPDQKFILLDFSAQNLRVCRSLMPLDRHPNVLCVQASALDLPLRDRTVALAWTVQVLQHLGADQRAVAFREMHRVLRRAGLFYIAWLRPVPMVRMVYRLFAKRYHETGVTPYGLYLDRLVPAVRDELLRAFPTAQLTLSESVFHPELRIRPGGRGTAALDRIISRSPLGRLMARQAEISGVDDAAQGP